MIQMEEKTMTVFREAVARIPTGMGHVIPCIVQSDWL